MDRIGADTILALVVALWFGVTGLVDLFHRAAVGGRRSVSAVPAWQRVGRRVRGFFEVIGGVLVVGGAAVSVLNLSFPFPGRVIGMALAVMSLWAALECLRRPVRWLRLAFVAVGFVLAVFYAGFRG